MYHFDIHLGLGKYCRSHLRTIGWVQLDLQVVCEDYNGGGGAWKMGERESGGWVLGSVNCWVYPKLFSYN